MGCTRALTKRDGLEGLLTVSHCESAFHAFSSVRTNNKEETTQIVQGPTYRTHLLATKTADRRASYSLSLCHVNCRAQNHSTPLSCTSNLQTVSGAAGSDAQATNTTSRHSQSLHGPLPCSMTELSCPTPNPCGIGKVSWLETSNLNKSSVRTVGNYMIFHELKLPGRS